MRVVVLHRHKPESLVLRALAGVGGGHIVRVHITGYGMGSYIKKALEMEYLLFVVFQSLHVFQIADMLAGEKLVFPAHAEACLLLGPAGQNAAAAAGHMHRIGHIAP